MHIWKETVNDLRNYLSFFDNSALQVLLVIFHFLLYPSTYLNITKSKLNNLGNARIRRHLFEALRYKPEDRGIEFRMCHWKFSLT